MNRQLFSMYFICLYPLLGQMKDAYAKSGDDRILLEYRITGT